MWKRDEPVPGPALPLQTHTIAVPLRQAQTQRNETAPRGVCIGQSVVIKGQLSASASALAKSGPLLLLRSDPASDQDLRSRSEIGIG